MDNVWVFFTLCPYFLWDTSSLAQADGSFERKRIRFKIITAEYFYYDAIFTFSFISLLAIAFSKVTQVII